MIELKVRKLKLKILKVWGSILNFCQKKKKKKTHQSSPFGACLNTNSKFYNLAQWYSPSQQQNPSSTHSSPSSEYLAVINVKREGNIVISQPHHGQSRSTLLPRVLDLIFWIQQKSKTKQKHNPLLIQRNFAFLSFRSLSLWSIAEKEEE